MVLIIAFDLSLSRSGYAVGQVDNNELTLIEVGSIKTTYRKGDALGKRLHYIAKEIKKLYKRYPDAKHIVKERSFSNGRITATQQIYKVVGVWELISYIQDYEEFTDIAPTTVKKQVTGNGRASKALVKERVKEITGAKPKNDDESDAIAVLLTYCAKENLIELEEANNA